MSGTRLVLLQEFEPVVSNCLVMNLVPPLGSPSLEISFANTTSLSFVMLPSSSISKRDAASAHACSFAHEDNVLVFLQHFSACDVDVHFHSFILEFCSLVISVYFNEKHTQEI